MGVASIAASAANASAATKFRENRDGVEAFISVVGTTERSDGEKIPQQVEAGRREHRLRMKLHAFDTELFVAQAHDRAVISFGGNLEVVGQRFALDDQ